MRRRAFLEACRHRDRNSRRPFLALLLLLVYGCAAAQPLAADGGWARPTALPMASTRAPNAAPAAGPTERAVASVAVVALPDKVELVWADQEGVWVSGSPVAGPSEAHLPGQELLPGQMRMLASAEGVRQVNAGAPAGELAVAWAQRDRLTGRYHHFLWWRGTVSPLLDDPLEVRFDFVSVAGVPYAAATLRSAGAARLTLLPLAGGDRVVLHTTELSVRGVTYAQSDDGGLWLAWLEGKTERTELGLNAEWDAFALFVAPSGAASSALKLGSADVSDERQRAAIGTAPGGAVVAWSDEDANLRAALLAIDGDAAESGATTVLATHASEAGRLPEPGRLLAVAWPYVYLVDGTTFKRLHAPTLLEQPVGAVAVTNLLWSPVTVEGAEFSHAAADAPHAIAWFGREEGGAVRLFASDDRAPMRVTWRDGLARAMGWNPWYVWEQAIGQALTAVLVGVLGALTLVPYFLVAAPLAARVRGGAERPRRTGAVIGGAPLVVAALALAAAANYGGRAPFAAGAAVAASLVVGVAVGVLVTRRGDREPQATILIAGAATALTASALWAFIAYPEWAPLVGLA